MRLLLPKIPGVIGVQELIFFVGLGMLPMLYSQANEALRLSPPEAKAHFGEMATVCGRVVDTKTSKYSVGGLGKPITFFLDSPQPNPEFSFTAWTPDPTKLSQLKEAYEGKRVCVTGKIVKLANVPHVTATDLSQIEVQNESRK